MSIIRRGGWPFRHPPNTQFRLNRGSPQARGLVAWWPTLGSYGSVLRDFSDYRNHGTLNDDATWAIYPEQGNVLDLDGTGDYVEISNNQILDFTSAYTLAGWIRPESVINYRPIWVRGEGNSDDIEIYLNASTIVVLHNRGNGGTITYAYDWQSPSANQWSHLTVTYNATDKWRLFWDGVEDTGGSIQAGSGEAPEDTSKPWRLGWAQHEVFNSGEEYFSGQMSDHRFYNRALSAAEVHSLYAPDTRWELYEPVARLFPVGKAVTAGDVTVTLSTLTLTSSAETLTIGAGAVAISLNELTLAGSVPGMTVVPGTIAITLNELTLASSVPAITIVPGAVVILLSELTLASSVSTITIVPGAAIIALNELTLAGSIPTITIVPGAVIVSLNELTLAGSAPAVTILTSVEVLLNTLTLVGSVPAMTVVPGAVAVTLNELTLAGSTETINIDIETLILLATLTLAGSVESLTVVPGAISVALNELTLAGNMESINVVTAGALLEALFKGMFKGMNKQ